MIISKHFRQHLTRWLATLIAPALALGLAAAPGLNPTPVAAQDTANDLELEAQRGGKRHRKRMKRPIPLGVSGSNVEDFNGSQCCVGTLGALIEKNGKQYILSNNHVLARTNRGRNGEAIIQPGLSDQPTTCFPQDQDWDTIAHLAGKRRIKFKAGKKNRVDAAIAEVVPGAVNPTGKILRIGVPGMQPIDAYIGQEVQKSGRTTGITRGYVVMVNTTLEVTYPRECGASQTRTATFVKQIIVQSANNKPFSDGGDSGSMVYEDAGQCPRPVGLLFAGEDLLSGLSPAKTVLKQVKRIKPKGPARFVGCESSGMEAEADADASSDGGEGGMGVNSGGVLGLGEDRMVGVRGVQRRWQDQLQAEDSVHAVGIGMTLSGPVEPAIYVLTTEPREQVRERLPSELDGYRVEVLQAPRFKALSTGSCDG